MYSEDPMSVDWCDLHFQISSDNKCFILGLTLGAGLSLAQMKDILADVVQKLPEENTQIYRALLKHLRTLAGSQIRNMAVCIDDDLILTCRIKLCC